MRLSKVLLILILLLFSCQGTSVEKGVGSTSTDDGANEGVSIAGVDAGAEAGAETGAEVPEGSGDCVDTGATGDMSASTGDEISDSADSIAGEGAGADDGAGRADAADGREGGEKRLEKTSLPSAPDVKVKVRPLIAKALDEINVSITEDETDKKRAAVLYLSISNATQDDLKDMAALYGLSTSGDIKSALLKKLGITVEDAENKESESENESFQIKNADIIQRKTINTSDFIFIDGNVKIEFTSSGSSKVLNADSVLFDMTENEILAFGNVSVSSSGQNSQLQNIQADGLFLNFKSNKIHLESAKGSTQKSSSTYYMSGDRIILDNKSSEIYFQNGALLPNDDVKNANWRIASRDIIMKSNGDMFMKGVLLKLGRVPILPLPALFMPGSALVINPAIGFSSEKGAFINTTYELYGTYPGLGKAGEGNSIINLLKTSQDTKMVKNGILYTPSESSNSSGSDNYMALFGDIYESEGLFLGLDTSNKFSNNITLDAVGGFAYRPSAASEYITSSTYKDFRYLFDSKLDYKKDSLSLSLKLPFYSDPYAKPRYLNRFTGFSFDSIFGSYQEFPSTYSTSSISDYGIETSLSYSLPYEYQNKYINNLSVNFSADHNRYWTQSSDGEYYRYMPGTTTLPSTTVSFSGTLFSVNAQSKVEQAKNVADTSYAGEDYSSKLERELLLLRQASSAQAEDAESMQDGDEGAMVDVLTLDTPASIDALFENLLPSKTPDGDDGEADEGSAEKLRNNVIYAGPSTTKTEAEDGSLEAIGMSNGIDESEASENVIGEDDDTTEDTDNSGADDANKKDASVSYLEDKRHRATANLAQRTGANAFSLSGSSLSLKYSFTNSFTNNFQRPTGEQKTFGDRRTTNSLSGNVSLAGSLGSNLFTFSSTLRPTYSYLHQADSTELVTNDFSLSSTSQVSFPVIGLGYNIAMQMYNLRTSRDANNPFTKTENKLKFDIEHISTHSLSFSRNFRLFTFSVSGALPPITLSFNPSVSFSKSGYSVSATHLLKGDDFQSIESIQTDGRFSYSNSILSASISTTYDWQLAKEKDGFFAPFKINQSLSFSLLDSWIRASESLVFYGVNTSGVENYFQSISLNLSSKYNYFSLSLSLAGVYDALELSSTKASVSVPTFSMYFWKRRIVLKTGFTGSANIDFKDAYQNSLTYSVNFDFEIKEFIGISISLNGENNNFTKYTGGNRFGKFNFGALLLDILRGVNILDFSDMRTSNFKMSSLGISVVHDMGDWDLRFNFDGNFELDGNEYKFSPKYSIVLKWKVIPELKVDKTIRP